jgi:hypothetical protein
VHRSKYGVGRRSVHPLSLFHRSTTIIEGFLCALPVPVAEKQANVVAAGAATCVG